MIENKTVLVLGAGASYEAGFPLGEELIRQVYTLATGTTKSRCRPSGQQIEEFLPNSQVFRYLIELGEEGKENDIPSEDDFRHFAQDLWDAKLCSIDDFLFMRPEYSLIGKLFIFFVLSRYENPERFKPQNINGKWEYPAWGWYEYLWRQLQEGTSGKLDRLKQNKLDIISFNYDRSLEHFLFTAIKATYGLRGKEPEIADFFAHISVKHVYGELGVLPWKADHLSEYKNKTEAVNDFMPSDLKVFYQKDGVDEKTKQNMAQKFLRAAREIKTYHEVSQDEVSKEIFKDVQRVYFLGCGYHDQNMKAIGLDKNTLSNGVAILGTAVGLTNHEKNTKQAVLNSINGGACKIQNTWDGLNNDSSKIASFLRNVDPLSNLQ